MGKVSVLQFLSNKWLRLAGLLLLLPVAVLYAQPRPTFNIDGNVAVHNSTIPICQGSRIIFSNTTSSFSSISWRFDKGNPTSSFSQVPQVRFDSLGISKAVLIRTDFDNRVDSSWVFFQVSNIFPLAAFDYLPGTIECGSKDFAFTDGSTGNGLGYSWNFGDNQFSNAKNPVHKFINAIGATGTTTYKVIQIVTNAQGCKDTAEKDITVKNIPDVKLGSGDPLVTPGPFNGVETFRWCNNVPSYTFAFRNNSSTIAANAQYKIKWGDGSPDSTFTLWPSGVNILHTYPQGNRTLTIEVLGTSGCTNTKTYNVFVGSNPAGGFASPGNTEVCAPDSLNFIISGTANNPPGTLYKVTVNDGTPVLNLSHPAPDTVTHMFTKSSCGISSSNGPNTFQNSFFALLNIENPCGATSVNVIPIYVSGKPNPNIAISPSSNLCLGAPAQVRLSGDYGGLISATGSGQSTCENKGKIVWEIFPNSGFTLSSGNRGNRNNSPENGADWTGGTESFNITFNAPGTYKIWQFLSNDRCGVDSIEMEICVRTPPSASFTMNREETCGTETLKVTNTSPIGECGGETYLWTIGYFDPLACGGTPAYSFVNGTNSASANPEIVFSNAGKYVIELRVSARAGGCTPAIFKDTITVRTKPIVTLNTINGICVGNTISPVANVNECYQQLGTTQYVWDFQGGSPATSSSLNPGQVLYATQGTFNVRFRATNDCGTTELVRQVVVGSKPLANAGADREVCSGASSTIGSSASPGVAYTWSPSTGISNPGAASTSILRTYNGPSSDTTYEYVVKASLGPNCESTDTVLIKVKRSPNVTVSPNATSLCTGGSAMLTASGADTYSWSPAAGLSATNIAEVTATPIINTVYTVTGSLANGCQATATATISMVSFNPGEAGPPKNYCSGLSTTIGVPSAGMNYSWQPSTGLNNANIASPTVHFVYNGPSSDTVLQYVLTASAGANCRNTDTVLVTVKRTPVVIINPAGPTICAGGSVQLTASGAEQYSWSPATGLSATDLEQVTANPVATTTYNLTGFLANGCSAMKPVTVAVINRPVVAAGRDTVACNNAPNVLLTGSPAGGTWSGSTHVTGGGVFNPRNAGNGTYKLYYSFVANGCDGIDSMLVTVQNPPASNAGRDTSICADGTVYKLAGTPSGGAWGGSPLVTAAGDFTASAPGVYELIYHRGAGSCIGYDTVKVTVVNTVSNNTISATQGVCSEVVPAPLIGSNASAGGLPLSYQWQSSPDSLNWTNIAGETGKDLAIPSPAQTIFYRRLANTSVCTNGSPSNGVRIFIHPNALADIKPTPLVACAPFVISPAVVNLTTYPDRNSIYHWYAGNTLIGTSETFPGYRINNPDDSIIIKLVTISRFGCVNDSVSVQFKTISNPSPSFTLSDSVGCGPLQIAITSTTPRIERYTFLWNLGNGQTTSAAQPGTVTYPINPSLGDTIYTVILQATGGCDTFTVEKKIRVRARPRTLFTPDKTEGCSPFTVTYNNNSAGSNASFEWDFGDGSPRVPAGFNSVSHTYFTGRLDTFRVRLFGTNDCGTDTGRFNLVVNPNRVRLDFAVNGDELNGCAPHTVTFINNTTGGNLFRWNFGDGSPVLTTNKGFDTIRHTYADTGRYVVTLFGTNGCSDTTSTEVINVSKRPLVSFALSPNSICLGSPFSLDNTSEQGLAWNWSFGDGTTSTLRAPVKNYTVAGTYRVVLKGARQFAQGFSCTDSAVSTINVIAPTGDWRYRGGYYCAGQPAFFEVTNSNATRYRFYFGNGDSVFTTSPNVSYAYPQPGSYLPRVVLEYMGCLLTLPGIDSIRIDKTATGFTSSAIQSCGATRVDFRDTSSAYFGISTWFWQFGDGTVSNQRNPTKIFNQTGIYPVTLRITGMSGCTDTMRMLVNIVVQQAPVVSISGDSVACVGQPARFTAFDVSNSATVFDWLINGGASQSGSSATNTWVQTGIYQLRLISRSSFGCADTAYRSIRVNPTPIVSAGNDVTICRGQNTRLTATGNTGLTWSPVQGLSCSDCANPQAGPNLTTQYFVTGINSFGCRATDSILVSVAQPFKISVTANDTICASLNESAQLFASGTYRYEWNPSLGLNAANIPNPVARPASTTLYRVIGLDAENCFTDTAFVRVAVGYNPTVNVPNGVQVVAGTQVLLNAQYTGGPFSRYTWTPSADLSCNNCPTPLATVNVNTRYTVVAETIYGCMASDTAIYTVECQKDQVFIPNAFSPDGDGVNDILMVRGKGVAMVKSFRVFNRFGQVVFEKQNFAANDPTAGWNGRIGGNPASADVYVYTAEVQCTSGGVMFTYKGNVTLFR